VPDGRDGAEFYILVVARHSHLPQPLVLNAQSGDE
jgi:hypothetical protein